MGRAHDNKILSEIRRRIIENPRKDYDDELFYAIMRSVWLGCSVYTDDMVAEDHGKKYLAVHIEGKGKEVPLKRILLDFTDRYLMLDGISLDGLLIEKGFIEEIISGFSGMRMPYRSDSMVISWSFMITVPRVENVPVLISLPKLAKSSSLSNVHEENAGMSTISVKATYK